jgi:DNA replication and repair protein RecF
MKINKINIHNFRNLPQLQSDFFEGVNIFYGDNGSGKTNLLEAIFVLCLGRSQRGASEAVMVRQEADIYRLEGEVESDDKISELAVAFQKGYRKKVTIDKVTVKTSELFENFCVVSAGPEDSEIISGGPSVRRNFIDIYLSQYSQIYLQDLVNYQKILNQKNAALKSNMDPSPFNTLMVETGSQIMFSRSGFIKEISGHAVENYGKISSGSKLELQYKPSVKSDNCEDLDYIKDAFQTSLERNFQREEIMMSSLVGPHRDDLYFSIDGYPARTHSSQGEWRTASLVLKIAVHQMIKRKRNMTPILLLDEIFAELDDKRSEALVGLFGDFKQLFLTTAIKPPEFLKDKSRNFKIDNGSIILVD